ncbi:hypothetical protein TNCV_4958121 [Trichonephila clavipes]|nr:hypothetical protein TNCV_4958121 [Trichonephila clavipes]
MHPYETSKDLQTASPPTRRVFRGNGLKLVTSQPRSDTLTTRLPLPQIENENVEHLIVDSKTNTFRVVETERKVTFGEILSAS